AVVGSGGPHAPAPADVLGIQIERLADPQEREDPGAVVAVDPPARLLERPTLPGGTDLARIDRDRVLEDRVHETANAVLRVASLALGEELGGHQRAWLERRRQDVVEVPV